MQREVFIRDIVPMRADLVAIARRYCTVADAEDVVQDTMIKLWCIVERIDATLNYRALAATAVRHAAIDRARAAGRLRLDMSGMERLPVGEPYDRAQEERYDAVMRLIGTLSHRLALIMKMRHVDGLEIGEIVSITGMTSEAVRMAISRGRRQIRDLYFKQKSYEE